MIVYSEAFSDLPEAKYSACALKYLTPPRTSFQLYLRENQGDTVTNHIIKNTSELTRARIENIPKYLHADWRDLPNKAIKLCNGEITKVLQYKFDDKVNGRGPEGELRGVCACAAGGKCQTSMRQYETIIPWCLPHTSNRHGCWTGLYGRIPEFGHFITTVTSPQPMGKTGKILHPTQDRICSVREWARSQGIPDNYNFVGDISTMYKSIGNAVPVPFAQSIGLQFKKAIIKDAEDALSQH